MRGSLEEDIKEAAFTVQGPIEALSLPSLDSEPLQRLKKLKREKRERQRQRERKRKRKKREKEKEGEKEKEKERKKRERERRREREKEKERKRKKEKERERKRERSIIITMATPIRSHTLFPLFSTLFFTLLLLLLLLHPSPTHSLPLFRLPGRISRASGAIEEEKGDPFNPVGSGDPFEPNGPPSGEPASPSLDFLSAAAGKEEEGEGDHSPYYQPPAAAGSGDNNEERDPKELALLQKIYGSTKGMVLPRAYTKPVRNFLCIGDSLTAGYTRHGTLYYPYTIRLHDLLSYYSPITPQIDNNGLSGQFVEQMVERLPGYFSKKYDWVIILGGTNNVIAGTDPSSVVNMLFQLHAIAHSRGAKSVAITIPEMASELFFPELRKRRLFINEGIRQYAKTHPSSTVLVDLALYLPQNNLSPANKLLYWDDGVHMTPTGYNYFGYLIYWFIRSYL